MLFILLSWLYILIVSLIIGITMNQLLGLKNDSLIVTILFGFFGITLLAGFWAIPLALNESFFSVLFFMSILLGMLHRPHLVVYWKHLKHKVAQLNIFFKGVLIAICILIIAQCASPPFLIDNESYYIQTIKWLNSYGFVPGLTNLHLFLGQTSGWHILQSAFNFSFLYDRFNDLSGLVLVLGNVYSIFLLNDYITKKNKSKLNLIFGLFPLWNVFFFQFISAPSPDLAIYVLSIILFHQFIVCYKNYTKESFFAVIILALFMAFIKLTGLVFFIFPLVLYKRYFLYTKNTTSIVVLFSSLTLLLFVIKNTIITGNLLFPLQGIEALKTSWSLPLNIETYFANYMQPYGYHLTPEAYETASVSMRLRAWLFAPIPHGCFNILMMASLVVMPFIIKKRKHKNAFWVIYNVAIINMIVLLLSSPQYRFFFPFILCFSLMFGSLLIIHKNTIKIVLIGSIIIAGTPLFLPLNNTYVTNNDFHKVSSIFKIEYLVEPYKNSKYSSDYKAIQVDETTIYSPTQIDFFWGTGDILLPALNIEQLEYFSTYFNVIPQQRSKDLKDGFYGKIIE